MARIDQRQVRTPDDQIDRVDTFQIPCVSLELRQPALVELQVGTGRGLGVDEELTLNELRNELMTKPRIEQQATRKDDHRDNDRGHGPRKGPGQGPRVGSRQKVEARLEDP